MHSFVLLRFNWFLLCLLKNCFGFCGNRNFSLTSANSSRMTELLATVDVNETMKDLYFFSVGPAILSVLAKI